MMASSMSSVPRKAKCIFLIFCHAMLCISAAYAVMWCLYVHPSVCPSIPSVMFVHSVEMNLLQNVFTVRWPDHSTL